MSDDEKTATLAIAAKIEANVSSMYGSGVTEVQLKPMIDLAHELKASAGSADPIMKLEPEPAPAPEMPKAEAPKKGVID